MDVQPAAAQGRRDPRAALALQCTAAAALVWVLAWDAAGVWWHWDALPGALPSVLLVVLESTVSVVVGLLVVRRRPRNVVGWLLVAHGCSVALVMSGDDSTAGSGAVALWVTQLAQGCWVFLYVFLALIGYLFPTGRFVSRRWRRWVVGCLVGHVVFLVSAALDADSFRETYPGVQPPFDVMPHLPVAAQAAVLVVGLGSVPALLVGAVASAVVRLRRAEGDERRQMLWFVWASLSIPGGLALCWLDYALGAGGVLQFLGVTVLGTVLPLAIGVAILRDRLFDIELVLSRTVTYGVLTVLVVGTYAVVLAAVRALAGSGDAAGLLAVGLVAVAVHPVHAQVRRRVD